MVVVGCVVLVVGSMCVCVCVCECARVGGWVVIMVVVCCGDKRTLLPARSIVHTSAH
jgi:hypothetical protein